MKCLAKLFIPLFLLLSYGKSYAQLKNTLSLGINSDYRYVLVYEREATPISFQIGVSQFSIPNLTNKTIGPYFDIYNMDLDTSFVLNGSSRGFNFFIHAKKEFGTTKVRPFVSAGLRVGSAKGGHPLYMEYCGTGINHDQVQIRLSRAQFKAIFIGGGLIYQPVDRFSLNLTLGVAHYQGRISNEDNSFTLKNNGFRIEAPQLLAIGFHF
jgi:hypothetical protein